MTAHARPVTSKVWRSSVQTRRHSVAVEVNIDRRDAANTQTTRNPGEGDRTSRSLMNQLVPALVGCRHATAEDDNPITNYLEQSVMSMTAASSMPASMMSSAAQGRVSPHHRYSVRGHSMTAVLRNDLADGGFHAASTAVTNNVAMQLSMVDFERHFAAGSSATSCVTSLGCGRPRGTTRAVCGHPRWTGQDQRPFSNRHGYFQ